jgi:hypothetical protein
MISLVKEFFRALVIKNTNNVDDIYFEQFIIIDDNFPEKL